MFSEATGANRRSIAQNKLGLHFGSPDAQERELLSSSRPAKRTRASASALSYMSVASFPTERQPNAQTRSQLLNLPPEIVDLIIGDYVLTAREHLALSGTCTALRLGYDDNIWKQMARVVFMYTSYHSNDYRQATEFECSLLRDPCSVTAARTIYSPVPAPSTSRIWSTALLRAQCSDSVVGIDFTRKCFKGKSKSAKSWHRTGRCKCMRVMGAHHARILSHVNRCSVPWSEIEIKYRALSDLVRDEFKERLGRHRNQYDCPRYGKRSNSGLYCLATVDATILRRTQGVSRAAKMLDGPRKDNTFVAGFKQRRESVEA